MAGTEKLEGKVLSRSLEMLNDVTNTLEYFGVRCSLDGGTALGVIREGRLLPWDTDMDIAIDATELKKLKLALWVLFFKGYRVRTRRLFKATEPLAKNAVRVVKVWRRKWLFLKGPEMLDIFVRYKKDDMCYWVLGGNKKSQVTIVNSMPAIFHDELKKVAFNNKDFFVAADEDGFLTYRYGDWRTPVKEWNAFEHDGAILTSISNRQSTPPAA